MVLAHTQGMRIGLVQVAFRIGGKGQQRFHFGVEWKASRMFQGDSAAILIQSPVRRAQRLLPDHHPSHGPGRTPELREQIESVANQESLGIDQQRPVLLGFDRKRSQH